MLTFTKVLIFNYTVHVVLLTHTVQLKLIPAVLVSKRHSSKTQIRIGSRQVNQWIVHGAIVEAITERFTKCM